MVFGLGLRTMLGRGIVFRGIVSLGMLFSTIVSDGIVEGGIVDSEVDICSRSSCSLLSLAARNNSAIVIMFLGSLLIASSVS